MLVCNLDKLQPLHVDHLFSTEGKFFLSAEDVMVPHLYR